MAEGVMIVHYPWRRSGLEGAVAGVSSTTLLPHYLPWRAPTANG